MQRSFTLRECVFFFHLHCLPFFLFLCRTCWRHWYSAFAVSVCRCTSKKRLACSRHAQTDSISTHASIKEKDTRGWEKEKKTNIQYTKDICNILDTVPVIYLGAITQIIHTSKQVLCINQNTICLRTYARFFNCC